ncbi:MAG: bifunctional phosphopantothenoylcysteine decarboxylase/phosphopantothenate--cysteine ligase CoaBC [Bacteroidetes bacterium]|nr:bifunctional phosphopantothenoylcysteine decarboxylase/phosphopantothenate--cysteine ligase CoaBC [Bacteroidota bacterium]
MLNAKKILLGISGGIAAYKSAYLIRMFVKAGAEVKVVVTPNALQFIGKVTLETLSKNKVYDHVFAEQNDYSTEHIALTDWADIFVIAPATANIIGKFANGIADDALSTSFLAFNKEIFIAPAMNTKMFDHYSVQLNMAYLEAKGVHFINSTTGDLACGYEGNGRMEEPEKIIKYIESFLESKAVLRGKHVMITAGPTYEAIDPVRFIGNHSSGKMGFALAEAAAELGAHVTLICGPVAISTHNPLIERINIVTANEMHLACKQFYKNADIIIMAAAVADYTISKPAEKKIKKSKGNTTLELTPTTDILAELGKLKTKKQILIGFALETNNETDNALKKLHNKNLDFIVLNSLKDKGAGFAHDTNKVSIFDKKGKVQHFDKKPKTEIARDIINYVLNIQ